MKLSKALNQKNKLVTEINNTFAKIAKYNSIVDGSNNPYDVKILLDHYKSKQEELIRLKTAVHAVSQPVRDKIFRLSELKSYAKKISQLDTKNGLIKEHGGYRSTSETIAYKATYDEVAIEQMVKETEKQIEALQEELDQFNYSTEVTW